MRKYIVASLIVLAGTVAQAASGDAIILDKTVLTLQTGTPLTQLTNFVTGQFPSVPLNSIQRLTCRKDGAVTCSVLAQKTDTCANMTTAAAAGSVVRPLSRNVSNCTYLGKEATVTVTGANLTALATWVTSFWGGAAADVVDVQCDKYTGGVYCIASGTKTLAPTAAADALIANPLLDIVGVVP